MNCVETLEIPFQVAVSGFKCARWNRFKTWADLGGRPIKMPLKFVANFSLLRAAVNRWGIAALHPPNRFGQARLDSFGHVCLFSSVRANLTYANVTSARAVVSRGSLVDCTLWSTDTVSRDRVPAKLNLTHSVRVGRISSTVYAVFP